MTMEFTERNRYNARLIWISSSMRQTVLRRWQRMARADILFIRKWSEKNAETLTQMPRNQIKSICFFSPLLPVTSAQYLWIVYAATRVIDDCPILHWTGSVLIHKINEIKTHNWFTFYRLILFKWGGFPSWRQNNRMRNPLNTFYFLLPPRDDAYAELFGFPWLEWLLAAAVYAELLGFPWLAWWLASPRDPSPLPPVSVEWNKNSRRKCYFLQREYLETDFFFQKRLVLIGVPN